MSFIYTVQPGDTLNEILNRFGITFQQLLEANPIGSPTAVTSAQVSPGQQIFIEDFGTGTIARPDPIYGSIQPGVPIPTLPPSGTAPPLINDLPGPGENPDFNLNPGGPPQDSNIPGTPGVGVTPPSGGGTGTGTGTSTTGGLVDINGDGIITAADSPGIFGPNGEIGAPPGWAWAFDPSEGDFVLRKLDPVGDTTRLDEWVWIPGADFDPENPTANGSWQFIANPEVPENIWKGLPTAVIPWFVEALNGRIQVENIPSEVARNWVRFFGRGILEHFTDTGTPRPATFPFGLGLPPRVLDGSILEDYNKTNPPATGDGPGSLPPGTPGSDKVEDGTTIDPNGDPNKPNEGATVEATFEDKTPKQPGDFGPVGFDDDNPFTDKGLEFMASEFLRFADVMEGGGGVGGGSIAGPNTPAGRKLRALLDAGLIEENKVAGAAFRFTYIKTPENIAFLRTLGSAQAVRAFIESTVPIPEGESVFDPFISDAGNVIKSGDFETADGTLVTFEDMTTIISDAPSPEAAAEALVAIGVPAFPSPVSAIIESLGLPNTSEWIEAVGNILASSIPETVKQAMLQGLSNDYGNQSDAGDQPTAIDASELDTALPAPVQQPAPVATTPAPPATSTGEFTIAPDGTVTDTKDRTSVPFVAPVVPPPSSAPVPVTAPTPVVEPTPTPTPAPTPTTESTSKTIVVGSEQTDTSLTEAPNRPGIWMTPAQIAGLPLALRTQLGF